MNSLGVCSLEQLAKDGSRYFSVAQGTMMVRYVDVQVLRDQVELEATQAGEEAPGQWNGIQAIDRKAIVEQLCLVREEADIEAKIMPDSSMTRSGPGRSPVVSVSRTTKSVSSRGC